MENDLFCSSHPKKHAKKHCIQCNLDLCNECALDFHIKHYQSLQKLNYNSKKKFFNYSELLCEEIKRILNHSLNDASLKLYNEIQNKAKINLKEYQKRNPNPTKFVNKNKINLENKKVKIKENIHVIKKEDKKDLEKNHNEEKVITIKKEDKREETILSKKEEVKDEEIILSQKGEIKDEERILSQKAEVKDEEKHLHKKKKSKMRK